jgi:serine protease Do
MTSYRMGKRLGFALAAGVAGAALFYGPATEKWAVAQNRESQAEPSPQQLADTKAILDSISQATRQVARQVTPAVVQIISRSLPESSSPGSSSRRETPDLRDIPEPLREFFREFGERGQGLETPPPQPRTGSGSGVIIDARNGYIITNNHVVGSGGEDERGRVDVRLADGRHTRGKVVGTDAVTDLALVQIEMSNLQAVPLGDSENMEVGDWVLAIGAPFGLVQSVTQGIISATGRSGVLATGYEDFLQTDAAINPGNSGGPLVNMRGEVIGINTAIATSGLVAGYQGVGFAIPTRVVKEILPDLKAGRKVVRGYLGVAIQGLEAQPGLARTFGLEQDAGVLIEDVQPRTPASKAGLRRQDVILAYGDTPVKSANHLQSLVARTEPDTKVDMKVWRGGKEITVPVTIEKMPEDFYSRAGRGRGPRSPGGGEQEEGAEATVESLGITAQEMTPALAKRYGWSEEDVEKQVVITSVEPLGEAAAVGISAGDIIVSIQDKQIDSVRALRQALTDEALEKGVRLQTRTRTGYRTYVFEIQ